MMPQAPPPRPAIGARIIRLPVVTSTNDIARHLARAGEPHGTVVVADEQTRGRGQRGRRWASPPGGLWASIIVRPLGISAAQAGLLNLAAAVAAAEAASEVSGVAVGVKWPNDLVVSGDKGYRKVGGVLMRTGARGSDLGWAVVGVGVNVVVAPEALPPRLRARCASLHLEAGREIAREDLLRQLCARVQQLLGLLEGGDAAILERWRALDTTPGRAVRTTDGRLLGRADGIDDAGRLMLRAPDGPATIATTRGLSIE